MLRKFKYIAIVGKSPIMRDVQACLEQMYPKKILVVNRDGSLVNYLGRDRTRWSDVFFTLHHDASVHPYMNPWFGKITGQNKLSNQAIGVIARPTSELPAHLQSILYELMLNDRGSLINGYRSVRYQQNGPCNSDDLKIAIAAIKSAVSE